MILGRTLSVEVMPCCHVADCQTANRVHPRNMVVNMHSLLSRSILIPIAIVFFDAMLCATMLPAQLPLSTTRSGLTKGTLSDVQKNAGSPTPLNVQILLSIVCEPSQYSQVDQGHGRMICH